MDADWSVELGADDPVLEFPWSSPDGPQHYVDLREHPEAVANIPEARQYSELAEFLTQANADSSAWMTVKCDVWLDDELAEAEAIYDANLKFCCYVYLIARDETARWSFERHESWVKATAKTLSTDDDEPLACELIVRRCWYHPDGRPDPERMTANFYVTLYLFGYGRDEAAARAQWARGLRLLTPVLVASGA